MITLIRLTGMMLVQTAKILQLGAVALVIVAAKKRRRT